MSLLQPVMLQRKPDSSLILEDIMVEVCFQRQLSGLSPGFRHDRQREKTNDVGRRGSRQRDQTNDQADISPP
jgi:hypothetical protein